jgi:hypothetical protein
MSRFASFVDHLLDLSAFESARLIDGQSLMSVGSRFLVDRLETGFVVDICGTVSDRE